MRRFSCAWLLLATAPACRGQAPSHDESVEISRLVDSLMPAVERAAGLKFKSTPAAAMRSRDQVKEYLLSKVRQEFPDAKLRGVEAAYKLLDLLPDSVALKPLLLALYAEQVAGFYEPDSSKFFGVEGGDPAQLRLVLAHEMVHALQHQYIRLDSILHQSADGDRLAAAQAIFEGQATLVSLRVMLPQSQGEALDQPEFWNAFRDQIKNAPRSMKVFASAPAILRESLVFPYLSGAEFMRWWKTAHGETPMPLGAQVPRSTEQILHPDRYASGDEPLRMGFADSLGTVLYEDTLGELEIQVFNATLRGGGEVLTSIPADWAGDRFRVYDSPSGAALVWYTAWDVPIAAQRFRKLTESRLEQRVRAGYRLAVDSLMVGNKEGVRIVLAPTQWDRWDRLPIVEVR